MQILNSTKYANAEDGLQILKCSCCNRNYQKKLNQDLKKQSANMYRSFSTNINRFISMPWKDIIYVNTWMTENHLMKILNQKNDFTVL